MVMLASTSSIAAIGAGAPQDGGVTERRCLSEGRNLTSSCCLVLVRYLVPDAPPPIIMAPSGSLDIKGQQYIKNGQCATNLVLALMFLGTLFGAHLLDDELIVGLNVHHHFIQIIIGHFLML